MTASRLAALAIKAKSATEQRHQEAKAERERQWGEVQMKAPQIANFMIEINKAFGKPAAIIVECHGEVILRSGEFNGRKFR